MSLQTRFLSVTTAFALLGVLLLIAAGPQQQADAAPLTACVNKKTGAMKMVFGKKAKRKCPKGSKKVTWQSEAGQSVYDAKGRRVGQFLGSQQYGPYTVLQVLRNGGTYNYMTGGALFPSVTSGGSGTIEVNFKTADCSGKAYVASPGVQPAFFVDLLKKALRGQTRLVFRTLGAGGLGVPSAWVGDGTVETVSAAIPTYTLNIGTGICEPDVGSFTGVLFGLNTLSIPKPIDFTGPLTIR